MSGKQAAKQVLSELKAHAPFTMFGAVLGIGFMLLFRNLSEQAEYKLFYIFHPAHVVLSAIVTASLFRLHERTKGFVIVLLVGYFGSVGIATLSDSIIPFFGESILGVAVPAHSELHGEHAHEDNALDRHQAEARSSEDASAEGHLEHRGPKIHIGFIEEWYIVNPAAFLGVVIAYFLPRTKLPHAGHILISTWASSAHVMMNLHDKITTLTMIGFFMVLFMAVWLPCCISDIIFPMLFVKSACRSEEACSVHGHEHYSKVRKEDEDSDKEAGRQ